MGDTALLAGGLALSPLSCVDDSSSVRPNIIVILADDMGYSDIGCYGSEISTPNLDTLAANGLRYSQFYNTARCCPTRASLLTGLYPHQTGIGHMTDPWFPRLGEGYAGDLNRNCLTIAEALKPAGYHNYAVGKWHVAEDTKPEGPNHNWPLQSGFDRFYGTLHGAGSFFDPSTLTRDNTAISPDADPEYTPDGHYYYTDAISDHACRFIREHDASEPFFIYVAYTAAHWPMHALPRDIAKYTGMYDGGYTPIREARLKRMRESGLLESMWQMSPQAGDWSTVDNKEWETRCMEVYAAMVDNMDQGIGRIMGELQSKGVYDNTLILFMEDNGGCAEEMGRDGEFVKRVDRPPLPPMKDDELQSEIVPKKTRDGYPVRRGQGVMPGPADTYIGYGKAWANVSNTPFREYKHWVHEGGISTPLIAHWPEGIKRTGEIEHQPGHLIDIMASCVDLSGASYPREYNGVEITPMQGKSLLPTFTGDTIERDAIYFEHEGNRAIRKGKWKLVAKGAQGKWQLYDMEADRSEMNDRADQNPQLVMQLSKQWEDWADRAMVKPWPWDNYTPPT
jgi:arylsulfatase A-like enzyme